MTVLVIGGGAAGMMAAISAADQGARVILAEKNNKLGKKLFITGKGRCNITNACPDEEFFDQVLSNAKFLYSSLYSYDAAMMCTFLEGEGLRVKEERGRRIFPASDKSGDVITALEKAIYRRHIDVRMNTAIQNLIIEDGMFQAAITKEGKRIKADALVVATGGLSYKSTGSTGDGYRFARESGHRVVECLPALVPLVVKEPFVRELEGLSLRNIQISMDKYRDFGEMVFTADGVSGPVILSASSFLCRRIAASGQGIKLHIDLKPALSYEQLDARLLRDFAEQKNRDFHNALSGLLPAKMIPVVVSLSSIPYNRKVNEITKEQRRELAVLLKDFTVTVTGTKGFEQAVITQGGINVRDIDPSTCGSKIVRNLFFAGEVLDVDAYTGGYNLQIAWSTGHLAGESAALCKH